MRTRIVKGTMNISSDGDIEFHTFGGDLTFRAGGKNEWTSPQTIVGAYEPIDVEDFPPENEKNKAGSIIVFIKPTSNYKGEFGIDYCEMNKDLTEITKIQGTDISNIEYIFDENTKQFRKATNTIEKHNAVKKLYHTEKYSEKEYYATWILLSVGQTANLRLNTFFIDESKKVKKNEEFITFGENPNFEIKYKGQTNNQIKIFVEKHNKEYDFEIKALKTFDTVEYIKIIDEKSNEVGIIEMSPNKVETLEVKIIPIIQKIGSSSNEDIILKKDAQSFYEKIKIQDIMSTLNQKSLNQVGIQCKLMTNPNNLEFIVIENNKDWKNYFDEEKKALKNWNYDINATENRPPIYKNQDGVEVNRIGVDDSDNIIDKLINAYYDKYDKTRKYKGALFFISDCIYMQYSDNEKTYTESPNTYGISRAIPIKNNGIIIFREGLKKIETYPHELAHMLGLEHSFFDEKDNTILRTFYDNIEKSNQLKTQAEQFINKNDENIKILKENEESLYKKKKYYIGEEDRRKKNYEEDKDDFNKNAYDDAIKKREEVEQEIIENNAKIDEIEKANQENREVIEIINKSNKTFAKYINIITNIPYKIKQSKTKNYMDYYIDHIYFSKQQKIIIQNDIKDYL